jgi:hypothetical protein
MLNRTRRALLKRPKKPAETVRRERGAQCLEEVGGEARKLWSGCIGDSTGTWLTMTVAERLGSQKGSVHIGLSPGKRLR